jgi:hypothetical protein
VVGGGKCVFYLHLLAKTANYQGVFGTLLLYFWQFLRILIVKNEV